MSKITAKAVVKSLDPPDQRGRLNLGLVVEFNDYEGLELFLERYVRGGATLTPNYMKLTIEDGEPFDYRPPNKNPFLTTHEFEE